jgi:hypothetical protein
MKINIKGNWLPISMASPRAIAQGIASRMKARRLQLGWSRKMLGVRSGTSQWTLKHFESTGQIALETLVKIAVVLNDTESFSGLFAARPEIPASLDELEKLHRPLRQRGRTLP